MQIYTQNPNRARKNMNFFESTSQRANRSTSFFWSEGSVMGLFRVCLGLFSGLFSGL